MAKDIKKEMKDVKESVKKVVTSDEAKKAVQTVVDTTETVVQTAVDTAASVVKKISGKEVKPTVYVQYAHREADITNIRAKAVEDFIANGHAEDEIKELKIYVKPEENAAYYVVNEEIQGKVQLF